MAIRDVIPEINLGAVVCSQLKAAFYPTEPWIEVHNAVAAKFSELKRRLRAFYTDKTTIEILQEVSRYSMQDIKDIFQ